MGFGWCDWGLGETPCGNLCLTMQRNSEMNLWAWVVCGFLALGAASGLAQGPNGYAPLPPPPPIAINQILGSLADQPGSHTGFVFDKNLLGIAQGVLEQNGMDAGRAAVALTGIQVDRYSYQQPAFYSPEAMGQLIGQYQAEGWKHLVNANATPGESAQPRGMITDLWLHFSGADINGLTVLTRSAKQMNVIQISGDLRPLDLVHLSGHFGIPKVDPGAVMVPAPR